MVMPNYSQPIEINFVDHIAEIHNIFVLYPKSKQIRNGKTPSKKSKTIEIDRDSNVI